ncbi:hypothetical protein WICPIJ_000440 [Wickerhamomyces pijperi]|uniref:Uncharacterized protein n=1 Tax=Wickerhamomyces pijperi TaxID=599730 RepID=A0A9P8TSL6_WICPI|nr:hypothetical protein WICPIJ_000440 [Wickerhamomyces pijperi]
MASASSNLAENSLSLELVNQFVTEQSTSQVEDLVPVLDLVSPDRGPSSEESTRWIPFHVGDTGVGVGGSQLDVGGNQSGFRFFLLTGEIQIVEFDGPLSGRPTNGGQGDETALWRELDGVEELPLDGLEPDPLLRGVLGRSGRLFSSVEGDDVLRNGLVGVLQVGVGQSDESVTVGFPLEVDNSVLQFDLFNWNVPFVQLEEFQVGEEGLTRLSVTVNLHGQVLGFILPVELHIRDLEQVDGSEHSLTWNLHQGDLSSLVRCFRGPVGQGVGQWVLLSGGG